MLFISNLFLLYHCLLSVSITFVCASEQLVFLLLLILCLAVLFGRLDHWYCLLTLGLCQLLQRVCEHRVIELSQRSKLKHWLLLGPRLEKLLLSLLIRLGNFIILSPNRISKQRKPRLVINIARFFLLAQQLIILLKQGIKALLVGNAITIAAVW